MKYISSICLLLLISSSLSFAYNFSYTINNPSSATADDFIANISNAVIRTEANLYIRTITFHRTYSKGHSFDGSGWIKLVEAAPPILV